MVVTVAADQVVIAVKMSNDIVTARQAGRELAEELGFTLTDRTMISTAISEVARNITSYAGSGEIRLQVAEGGGGGGGGGGGPGPGGGGGGITPPQGGGVGTGRGGGVGGAGGPP
ncbi:ATP-binding protein, partial [Nocardia carnea]|uniref:ATP-binding protein n=1 Tax=Nocardia carnea TaxID=37328 RepID=UPI003D77ED20